MDLKELRDQIDQIDIQIQDLFEQRMDVVKSVAAYKKQHQLPVLHTNREDEVIRQVTERAAPEYASGEKVLFTNIMDISKCSQKKLIQSNNPFLEHSVPFSPDIAAKVACQGVPGAYSHIAARALFKEDIIHFYRHFEEVFQAVINEEADYGILPIENSNAGSVVEVYELLKKYNIYIARRIKIEVNHCLAALPGTQLSDIKCVFSHEQGIQQCSSFIHQHNLTAHSYSNTAAAAEYVAQSDPNQHFAAICSNLGAQIHGLQILSDHISNIDENYTRFICISKKPQYSKEDNIISISFSLPHTVGSLYRMLTKFSVYGINMQKIESKPIGNKNFDIMFYLDFTGNLKDENVSALLNDLAADLLQFKYLGNYIEI